MGGLRQQSEAGERIFRIDGTFTIGRDPHSDLVLADHVVSSRHASVLDEAGRFTLVDHQSRNGTYVQRAGNEPVRVRSSHQLFSGDVIRIGSTRLVFDSAVSPETPLLGSAPPPESRPASATSAFPPTEQGRAIPVFLGGHAPPSRDAVLERLDVLEARVAKLEAELRRMEGAD
jgi:pSer/pThr/pTyr-binding forkhead associated (FHA) protein